MESPVMRLAQAEEVEALSALALRSEGYWGYTTEFLEACREDLTVPPPVRGFRRSRAGW